MQLTQPKYMFAPHHKTYASSYTYDDHNPPTNAPPPKRATRQQSSSAGATSQPPLRIVNAVLQGLPSTKDPPATQPDEDEDLEDFNGEQVIM